MNKLKNGMRSSIYCQALIYYQERREFTLLKTKHAVRYPHGRLSYSIFNFANYQHLPMTAATAGANLPTNQRCVILLRLC